jgi:hypothetical protein
MIGGKIAYVFVCMFIASWMHVAVA